MNNLQLCLSRNMKFNRKKLGLSQMALAELVGTAPNYIALIEAGKSFPSLPMLERIASALQLDALDLFDKNAFTLIDTDSLKSMLIDSMTKTIEETLSSKNILQQ